MEKCKATAYLKKISVMLPLITSLQCHSSIISNAILPVGKHLFFLVVSQTKKNEVTQIASKSRFIVY